MRAAAARRIQHKLQAKAETSGFFDIDDFEVMEDSTQTLPDIAVDGGNGGNGEGAATSNETESSSDASSISHRTRSQKE